MHKMCMQIIAKTKDVIDINNIATLCFGGFSFEKDNVSMSFDFAAFTCHPEKNKDGTVTIIYESGRGLFFNDYEIDKESYESLYDDELSIDDVDAKLLASTDNIYELFYDIYLKDDPNEEHLVPIFIESISFFDIENSNKEYNVNKEVIDKFNKTMEAQ